jgi:FlaA1/EpsC-like NDP-sugar epimerase
MGRDQDNIRVLIVGAGKAGELLAEDIRNAQDSSLEVVGLIDDNSSIKGEEKYGLKVLGTISELSGVIHEYNVEELIIALPSARGEVVRRIINCTEGCKVSYKILPRDSEVLFQDFSTDYLKHIRKVVPEDLLGGVIEKDIQKPLAEKLEKEVVMITGAAGSIGSELSRQIAVYGAQKIVFFDWWENGMFELRQQVLDINPDGDYEFVIGDMKDRERIGSTMKKFAPTTVFHAGAYKHVPLMEDNPIEALKNNIIGTRTVAESAIRNGVKKFVLVSSDKAVNPTNIMGATKRAAEKIIHVLAESQSVTFCAVRFGNVVNSNGSVIPFFKKQIEKGGPVTITHKDVTRFFMTIPEACTLILRAWVMGENNDLFVLDMGESIKIADLARTIIILEGYVPDHEIKMSYIGLRPGEKLYEEVLVGDEETNATAIDKIFKTKNYMDFDKLVFLNQLNQLQLDISDGLNEAALIKDIVSALVPTYSPSKD